MAEKKRDPLGLWVKICGAIIATASVLTLGWATLAEDRIDKQIHKHTDPLQATLEYQCFLIMETMPDSAVKRADARYFRAKNSKAPWEDR